VTLNEVTITDGTLTTSSGGVILQSGGTSGLAGSMTLKGTLNVADNNALILSGVTLTNNGALNLNSSSHDTDLVVAGGTTVTLNGTGSVNLTGTGTPRIYGSGYNATLNNQETIQGAGRIDEDGEFALNNSGTIDANVSGGTLGLGIGLGGLATANTGTLEATKGGNLQLIGLNNGAPSSLTNTGGTIAATGANSTVTLNGVTITDGTLATSSGGVILQSGGTSALAGSITLKGTLNVADNNALVLNNGLTLTDMARSISTRLPITLPWYWRGAPP